MRLTLNVGGVVAALVIRIVVPLRAQQVELAFRADDVAMLHAFGLDERAIQERIDQPELKRGDARIRAGLPGRCGHEGVGARQREPRARRARIRLIARVDPRPGDRGVDFVVVVEAVAHATVAHESLGGREQDAPMPTAAELSPPTQKPTKQPFTVPAAFFAAVPLEPYSKGYGFPAASNAVPCSGPFVISPYFAYWYDWACWAYLNCGEPLLVMPVFTSVAALNQSRPPGAFSPNWPAGTPLSCAYSAEPTTCSRPSRNAWPAASSDQILPIVAVGADAALGLRLEALESFVGDEVDDAAHGVGPIRGRCAARYDIDAVHQQLRELADIGNAGHVRSYDALPVEQRQRADGSEAVQGENELNPCMPLEVLNVPVVVPVEPCSDGRRVMALKMFGLGYLLQLIRRSAP